MSRQLTFCLIGDGGTDRALVPIIEWAIHKLDPDVELLEPEFRKRSGPVGAFLSGYRTGAMMIFVHRDAEGVDLGTRLQEFDGVHLQNVVPVVPVRMTEAWLLIDGPAIARAAGRPSAVVELPSIGQLETVADPKERLHQLLFSAAGEPTGRRAKQLRANLPAIRVNVASLIEDFGPLEGLPAFASFQARLAECYPYPT